MVSLILTLFMFVYGPMKTKHVIFEADVLFLEVVELDSEDQFQKVST